MKKRGMTAGGLSALSLFLATSGCGAILGVESDLIFDNGDASASASTDGAPDAASTGPMGAEPIDHDAGGGPNDAGLVTTDAPEMKADAAEIIDTGIDVTVPDAGVDAPGAVCCFTSCICTYDPPWHPPAFPCDGSNYSCSPGAQVGAKCEYDNATCSCFGYTNYCQLDAFP